MKSSGKKITRAGVYILIEIGILATYMNSLIVKKQKNNKNFY